MDCERVLAIGRRSRPPGDLPSADGTAQIELLGYDELLVSRDPPQADLVLSPMVGDTFDCLDVAVQLHAQGFRGRLHVVAPALPDPAILRREVASMCPGIHVDVVIQDERNLVAGAARRLS